MFQKLKKPLKFLIIFSVSSFLLLVIWEYISVLYLNFLVIFGNPVLSILNYPLKLTVENNNLQFIFFKINSFPLKYTVYETGEIYLNLIILISLFSATYMVISKRIYKELVISLIVIFILHEIIVYSYAYSHIWNVVSSQSDEIKNVMSSRVSKYFSYTTAHILDKVNYHWGAWGWDLTPVILWILSLKSYFFSNKRYSI